MATDNQGSSLGLFFTARTVVAVEIRAVRGGIEIPTYGVAEMPQGAIEENAIADARRLGQTIRTLLRKINCTTRSAHVALFSGGYNMRTLRMPDVPAAERRILVRGELEASGALPAGGGTFDFAWSSVLAESGARQAEVYAYYAADSMVEKIREAIQHSGLRLAGMEPASLAMIRAYLAGSSQRFPLAFLCPAEKHSDLCIHDGQKIQHMRRIPGGWGDYAREVDLSQENGYVRGGEDARASDYARESIPPLNIDLDIEGGALRLSAGEDLEEEEFSPLGGWAHGAATAADTEEPEVPVGRHLRQRASSTVFLASEITRTLAFYAREHPTALRPEAFVVLGVGPLIDDFRLAVADSVPLPLAAEMTSVFGVALPENEADACLAAVGAAVGKMEPTCPQLDISQQETVAMTRQRAPVILLAGMTVGTVWAILSALAAITLTMRESTGEQHSLLISRELQAIKAERAPLLHGQEILTAINTTRARSEVPAPPVLGRVAAATTPGVVLTGLHITGDGKVALDGHARDVAGVQRFAALLGQGNALQAPTFDMMRQDATAGLQFRITGVYPRTAAPAEPAPTGAGSTP